MVSRVVGNRFLLREYIFRGPRGIKRNFYWQVSSDKTGRVLLTKKAVTTLRLFYFQAGRRKNMLSYYGYANKWAKERMFRR